MVLVGVPYADRWVTCSDALTWPVPLLSGRGQVETLSLVGWGSEALVTHMLDPNHSGIQVILIRMLFIFAMQPSVSDNQTT